MANTKIKATAQLFLDTSKATSDAKQFVADLKKQLSSIETAADKMTVFKDMVAYIAQIDRALSDLKFSNSDAFKHMFDGMDTDLRKQFEDLFGISDANLGKLNTLREKLATLTPKSGIAELRKFAKDLNDLFEAIGAKAPFDIENEFAGKATQAHIDKLTDTVNNFAIVWDGVRDKIKSGFGLESSGTGDGAGGLETFTGNVQKEITKLEAQLAKLKSLQKDIAKTLADVNKFNNDGNIFSDSKDFTQQDVLNAIKEFNAARKRFNEFSGDTGSVEYNEILSQYLRQASEFASIYSELRTVGTKNNKLFTSLENVTPKGNKNTIGAIMKRLNEYAEEALFDDSLINSLTAFQGSLDIQVNDIAGQISKLASQNKNAVLSYDELSQKVKEYYALQKKINDGLKVDEDGLDLESQIRELDKLFLSLDKTGDKAKEITTILGDLAFGDITESTAIDRFAKMLNISKDAVGEEVGTARGAGTGTGSGSGGTITDIDFSSLESTIKSEVASLASKLDNTLKVEVVKNNVTEIQNAINDLKSSVEKISAHIDKYNSSKKEAGKQAEIDAMKANLTQLHKFIDNFNSRKVNYQYQDQEIGASILSDGTISVGYGEDGTVPWNNLASALVGNLTKSLLVDVHSHPWEQFFNNQKYANDFFSGSHGDLGAFRRSKKLGAQIASMITGNIMRTLDLSKLTDDQWNDFRSALDDIEWTYANTPEYTNYMVRDSRGLRYKTDGTLENQHKVTEAFESLMYKAFERIGFSKDKVDREIFKKYDLTDDSQLTALAEHLVRLSHSAQMALSPVDRLAEIISDFNGDTTSSSAKDAFLSYTKGELTAAEVFNKLTNDRYKINQDTINSLLTIDSAHEISAVESLLTQITGILNTINSNIANIDNNTRKNTSEQFDVAINDLLDLRNDIDNKNLIKSVESIFDPLNVSQYKNNEVMNQARDAFISFKDLRNSVYADVKNGNVNVDEIQLVLKKFATAVRYLQDAQQQVSLYEERTREEVKTPGGNVATHFLSDQYDKLISDNNLQALMKLLSQAKLTIQKEKASLDGGLNSASIGQDSTDNGALVSQLQTVNSTLQSIYGVLHGFTGIESDNKNSLKYKEPIVDTDKTEFTERDLSILNSILQAIQEIGSYLHAQKPNDTTELSDQSIGDISELANFIKSKLSQQLATEDSLQALKGVVDNLYASLSNEEKPVIQDDKDPTDQQQSDIYQLLSARLPHNIASEDTLVAIRGAIEQLSNLPKDKDGNLQGKDLDMPEGLQQLVLSLSSSVKVLQDVANGIIRHQDAQKTDTSAAMAKIADPTSYKQIVDIASNSVGNLGSEVQIKSLKALADGAVFVEGAFKNASGAWEGFTVEVNESNDAVGLAINRQSAYAKSLNATSEALKQQKIKDKAHLNTITKQTNELYKSLKLDPLDTSDSANAVKETYAKLIDTITQYKAKKEALTASELDGLKQIYDQLMLNAQAYAQQNTRAASPSKKAYGTGVMSTAMSKYNSLQSMIAQDDALSGSQVLKDKFQAYEAAYARLEAVYNRLQGINPTANDEADFKQASAACNSFRKDVEKLIASYNKLHNDPNFVNEMELTDFDDSLQNRQKVLTDYVEAMYGSKAKIGDFKNNYRELIFTIDNGDGTFTEAKASIDSLGSSIVETAGDTKKATSKIEASFNAIKSKTKELWVYAASRLGVDEIIQQVRQGIQYVREIDSALTELKKVTSETDATYDAFLQHMSKTGSVIGSTVADLTTMAAEWARLGYSLEEAGMLAESTAILMNVSEFNDATAASEALISTMQAFGYAAEDSEHVVDILNEVKVTCLLIQRCI